MAFMIRGQLLVCSLTVIVFYIMLYNITQTGETEESCIRGFERLVFFVVRYPKS